MYALRGGQEGGLSIAHNIIGSKEKDLKTVERRGRKDEAEDSENRSLYFTHHKVFISELQLNYLIIRANIKQNIASPYHKKKESTASLMSLSANFCDLINLRNSKFISKLPLNE